MSSENKAVALQEKSIPLALIAAVAENGVIGADQKMPWHLGNDLQYFKALTTGNVVIMGRKTFQSIGRALPNRKNIVISRQQGFKASNCQVANTLAQALGAANKSVGHNGKVFVIGGAQLYEMALPQVQTMYLTEVHMKASGDTFFPSVDFSQWQEQSRERHYADDRNDCGYSFVIYQRVKYTDKLFLQV